jgi:hypothetical protein
MNTRSQAHRGLSTLDVLMVIATLALLGVFFYPRMLRKPHCVTAIRCVNNLKQVGLAYRLVANDHEDRFPFAVSNALGGSLEFVNSPKVFKHFEAMSNELVSPKLLACPVDIWAGGRLRAVDFLSGIANSNVSYFVGPDGDEAKPERILSGDRNITGGQLQSGFMRMLQTNSLAGWTPAIHSNAGNVGLSDGSVQQMTAKSLRKQLQANMLPTIRLAIP